jgi:hypothetical protein
MFHDDRPTAAERAPEIIDRRKRELVKSAAGLMLAAGVGLPASRLAFAQAAPAAPQAAPPTWGDAATLVSAIGAGTLAVASVAESAEAYRKGFGYTEHWRGPIPKATAEFWGVPAMAGRNAAVLGAPGVERGMLRIVELGKDFQKVSYHDTLGWLALEIQAVTPETVIERLKGLPFVHTGGPSLANDPTGRPLYRAAQFTGPSGEPLNMTQHMQLNTLSPLGRNSVGPLFIQTLATAQYPATRDFYLQTLGFKMRLEMDSRRTSIVEKLGLPKEQRFKLSAVRMPEFCSIELDEFPQGTPERPASPGCFAAGVAMCTLTTRNLDAVKAALKKASVKFAETANACPPFNGARTIFCTGRGGERLEVVEVGKA